MINIQRAERVVILAVAVAVIFGVCEWRYTAGFHAGTDAAWSKIAAETSEHNRAMQSLGLCQWAKQMASTERCGSELP